MEGLAWEVHDDHSPHVHSLPFPLPPHLSAACMMIGDRAGRIILGRRGGRGGGEECREGREEEDDGQEGGKEGKKERWSSDNGKKKRE